MADLLAPQQPPEPPLPPELLVENCDNPLYRLNNPYECAFDAVAGLASDAAGELANSAFGRLARAVGQAAAEMFAKALTWWVTTPTLVDPTSVAVRGLWDYTQPVVVLVLLMSVLAQAIRMVLSRKKDPAVDVGIGLVRFAVITALGLIVLGAALTAADALARSIMERAVTGFAERMSGVFAFLVTTQPFMLFAIGLIVFVLSCVQWVLAFLRQAGILVLATMIPLAASGSVNRSTRPWMSKLAGWLIALVAYKPMAALIYAIGFELMGGAQDLATAVTGVMVLALAVLALPAMLRFFQWAPVGTGGGGGTGGVLAGGAIGAVALSQISGGGSANRQADFIGRSGPQTAPDGAAAGSPAGSRALPAGGGGSGGASGATVAGAGGGGAAAASGAAAAAGPAGVAVVAGTAAADAAKRAPGSVANNMTGES